MRPARLESSQSFPALSQHWIGTDHQKWWQLGKNKIIIRVFKKTSQLPVITSNTKKVTFIQLIHFCCSQNYQLVSHLHIYINKDYYNVATHGHLSQSPYLRPVPSATKPAIIIVMSCMRVCRKQALSRVKYYYYVINSKIQQATIMTVIMTK